ncbi:hypothetical protein [Aquipseudomonas ullengensis]|uniref:DUF2059 domain-containing protein n=1 Tax=Aquipseudomonas ullengensis TaxID=2759166 RepID=A0A7W4LJ50_9GAMM|nr:hypothetical protein [Pseudomonas ullengensis]MBB2494112.1 hypothetical protein [Pseudomonas ullengensis]
MRLLTLIPLLFTLSTAQAAEVDPALNQVLELAGVQLLCAQTAPLLQRGMPAKQQKQLGTLFAAGPLCADLARQLSGQLSKAQVDEALKLLNTPLARHFTEAERAVGVEGGLGAYRAQLSERPPRQDRLALVQRLDKAAHTTEMATLLRYEVGKTQALMTLRSRGKNLDEKALTEQTTAQVAPLRASSASGVEAFMLYAYRRTPSSQLGEYAALYEQAPLRAVLEASAKALPTLFAARRAKLK